MASSPQPDAIRSDGDGLSLLKTVNYRESLGVIAVRSGGMIAILSALVSMLSFTDARTRTNAT
jgi:hypothetical protein